MGQELNLSTVLTGSVQRSGNRLRITAQLANATDGFNLWTERYDRELDDLFAVQDEIARNIAQSLRITLRGGAGHSLVGLLPRTWRPTRSIKKDASCGSKGERASEKGFSSSNRPWCSIRIYPLALAGVADSYSLLGVYGLVGSREAGAKALPAAERAVTLDDQLAEAHNALAYASWSFDWDWVKARREFERSIGLNPGYAPAHNWYGQWLAWVEADFERAISELQRAVELDPLNAHSEAMLSSAFTMAGDTELGLRHARRSLELDPVLIQGHIALFLVYRREARHPEALQAARVGVEASNGSPQSLANLVTALHATGQSRKADEAWKGLVYRSGAGDAGPVVMAMASAGRGRLEETLPWLERAWEQRSLSRLLPGLPLPLERIRRFSRSPFSRAQREDEAPLSVRPPARSAVARTYPSGSKVGAAPLSRRRLIIRSTADTFTHRGKRAADWRARPASPESESRAQTSELGAAGRSEHTMGR